MAAKNSKYVHVAIFTYKQAITDTFGVTLSASFLLMPLICGGKTAQSFPKVKFPETFSFIGNSKHFSNMKESLKLLEEIIISYVKDEQEKLKLELSQPALMMSDIFSGEITILVTDKLKENHMKYARVPVNMTNLFKPPSGIVYKLPSSWTVGKATSRLKSSSCSQHLNNSMLIWF